MSIAVQGERAAELSGFDTLIETFLQNSDVPAMALAVARQGKLLLSRTYTDTSKSSDPVNRQNSPSRCASCSKMITRIAINQLIEKNKKSGTFRFDSFVAPLLGNLLSVPNTPIYDPARWESVQVADLLLMQSGLHADFLGTDAAVCKAFGHSLPVASKMESIAYGLTLANEGALKNKDALTKKDVPALYRNFDFLILSALVEKVSGQDYVTYVTNHIFAPLGLTRPQVASSTFAGHAPYEFTYHPNPPYNGNNVMSDQPPTVPAGDGDINMKIGVGVGGWLMTVADFAKILSAFAVRYPGPLFQDAGFVSDLFGSDPQKKWPPHNYPYPDGSNPGTTSYEWGGILPGSRYYASLRTKDGVVIVASYNTDEATPAGIWNPGLLTDLHKTADQLTTWPKPDYDLFPSAAIPSFSAGANWGGSGSNVAAPGSGWHGWYPLGGQLIGHASAVVGHPEIYDVYAIGVGGRIWQKWWDRASWQPRIVGDSGWSLHDDGTFRANEVSALALSNAARDLYLVGTNSKVYQKWWDGKWHGPNLLGGGALGGVGVVAPTPTTRDLYVAGLDSRLHQCWWDGSAWSGWVLHKDGFVLKSAPAVISHGANHRDVYAVGQDGHVHHKSWNGSVWSAWTDIGMPAGGAVVGSPGVVEVHPGFVDVYVRGADDRLYQKWFDGTAWHPSPTGWSLHDDGAFRLASSPAVISESDQHRGLFVTGKDGCMYYKYRVA